MYCNSCGKENAEGVKFCGYCGKQLLQESNNQKRMVKIKGN